MKLQEKYEQVNSYIEKNVLQLTGAYLLIDYYQLKHNIGGGRISKANQVKLNKAKEKSITADSILKLNKIIIAYNNNQIAKIDKKYESEILEIFSKAEAQAKKHPNTTFNLYIDHDLSPQSAYVLMTDGESKIPEFNIKTGLDFGSIWGILESEEWYEISEMFEDIILRDELFMVQFELAFKLQSYVKFVEVLKANNIIKEAKERFPGGLIAMLGEHDNHVFEIINTNR